jgi:hypothetical protein
MYLQLNVMVKCLVLLHCISEVLDLNVNLENGYPDMFLWFSSASSGIMQV